MKLLKSIVVSFALFGAAVAHATPMPSHSHVVPRHGAAYVGHGWGHGYYGGFYSAWWPWYNPWFYGYPMGYPYSFYVEGAGPAAPVDYVEMNSAPPGAPAGGAQPGMWYYCASAQGYHPYVKECPGGWQNVPAQPAQTH